MEKMTMIATATEVHETKPLTVSKLKEAFDHYVAEVKRALGWTDEQSGQVTRPRFQGFIIPKGILADFKSAYNLFTEVGDLEASMKKVSACRRDLVRFQYSYAKYEAQDVLDRKIGTLLCEGDLRTKVNEAREKYEKMLNERHHIDVLSVQFWLVHDTVVDADREQTERVAQRDLKERAKKQAKREAREAQAREHQKAREARAEANRKAAEEVNRNHRISVGHTIMDQLSQIIGQKSMGA